MRDDVQIGVRELVHAPAGVDHARREERRTGLDAAIDDRRLREVHQLFEVEAALCNTPFIRAANHDPPGIDLEPEATRRGERGAEIGKIRMGAQDDDLVGLCQTQDGWHTLDRHGNVHAGLKVVLKIVGRLHRHGRGVATHHNTPPCTDHRPPCPRSHGGITAIRTMHLVQALAELILSFAVHVVHHFS